MTTTTLPTRADELRVRIATLVEQAISERSSVWAVARDARIPRSTLTRRLKGETPGFYSTSSRRSAASSRSTCPTSSRRPGHEIP